MPNKVLLKKSSVTSKVPLTTDLDYGELALNYADGKLYFKNSSNAIKSFTIDDSVVTLTGTQTLTNKTLTSPTINGGALSGTFSGTHTYSGTTTFSAASGTIFSGGDGNNSSIECAGYNQRGGSGYHGFLEATNTFGSATNPNKYFRLNSGGALEIVNSAYTTTILSLTDTGTLTVPAISAGGTVGTSGQVLQSTGTGLQWASVGGTGTVTSITAGTGLSGGTITSSGTIALANTAVTAGSYTLASITVDAQGRITSASSGSGGGTVNTGTAGQLAFYASSTTAVSPLTALTWTSGTTTLALSGTFSATTLTETSDARLKTNVQPITNALSIVNALDGKTFIKDKKERVGLIAQQVQQILPQVVETADDEMKTLSVSYGSIVAVLIEAIKEQQVQIDELKAKLGN